MTSHHRRPNRPALIEMIAEIGTDPASDEAYFLEQLRAAVAAVETPADRLLARYRAPFATSRFGAGYGS